MSEPWICPGIIPRQETMASEASPPGLPLSLEQPPDAAACCLWVFILARSRPSTCCAPIGPLYSATQQSANRQKNNGLTNYIGHNSNLHLGWSNTVYDYRLREECLGCSPAERHLGMLVRSSVPCQSRKKLPYNKPPQGELKISTSLPTFTTHLTLTVQ